ncbi:hypothetical protein CK501_15895 [Halovibrio salipaludis]|uniref:Uncharacterized protein n=1 Tax=Halovibrio salipaludis TaxID=2032626 RepID=A0A2A2EVN5_9GAMM|nr:hypothetical protein [Halovibrio salipaludis]PAU76417.1 hypothetical protein CK501_15895 [Halovibrio salipaludis]
MTKWILSPQDEKKHHHFEPESRKYVIKKAAYLPQEGIGVNGNFFIKGSVVARGTNIFVTAMGFTPAMELPKYEGAFEFYGSVMLLSGNETVTRKRFKREGHALWPENGYAPIGSVMLYTPPAYDSGNYSLRIEASYWFDSGVGTVTPMPRKAETVVELRGVNAR